ncbi:glycoside hydrolase family 13 protein [Shewanella aegiceratis]|uniref:glycoside hydrolase family 13 protein n=1 Tax=Shewanella aegiceratis TaxID=2864203 RepID=UPI001C66212E|nr:glycoside hydrolase family 13 protein [Shewanella aegiceratis]QYJ84210.1 glycoside hydrolase family 13 protein [Shewanella aegiceratis]
MRRTNNQLKLTLIATSLLMLAPSAFQVMASVLPASSSIISENTSAQKLRIEPLNWWAGMQHSQLQLMVHGENIAKAKVSVKADGVTLKGVETTENPNYLFVNLDTQGAKAQTFELTFEQAGQAQISVAYELLKRDKGSAAREGFSNKDVIYLITPDRFANGDPANDNQADMIEQADRSNPGGRHGGDIQGIINNLDYLADLGVTQLWINPLTENNQAEYSYHGYSVTDHYRIDPRFGSNDDYRQLAIKAKEKGIGIIADVVVNHIGANHWWMDDLPSQDWVNRPEGALAQDSSAIDFTTHRRTTLQDPYAVAKDKRDFSHGWFVESMPDLNQEQPQLANYLIQNSIWWVEYAHLSGIREDTYSYADKDFLVDWTRAIMAEYPKFNIVGEEWTGNPITVSYWQKGKVNQDGYQSELPSLMDFPLYETLIKALSEEEGWSEGMMRLYEFLANDVVYADPTQLVLFEGNHDTNRLYSLLGDNLALTKMALAYVLTSNRIPQIFYGSEILMQSPTKDRNDGVTRSDLPGGWQGDAISVFDNKGLNKEQQSMLSFTRALLNFRKQADFIHSGGLRHYVPQDGVYVQMRCAKQDCSDKARLMVIYNKLDKAVELPLARYRDLLGSARMAQDVISGDTVTLDKTLSIKGQGVTLLAIEEAK